MSSASADRLLAALLAPVVERAGLDLEDVEVTPAGKRRQVRVLVDKDGGVSLDDVALASQSISAVLDADAEADALLGSAAYVLEVSSPGVDRPLVQPRHWRRALGRLVRVRVEGAGELTGRVVGVDADGVRLETEPTGPTVPTEPPGPTGRAARVAATQVHVVGFDQLGPGRVQVEFNRPAAEPPGPDAGGPATDATRFDETEESR